MNLKSILPRQAPTETLADLTWRNRQAIRPLAQVRHTDQPAAQPVTSVRPADRQTDPAPKVRLLPPVTPPPPAQTATATTDTEPGGKRRRVVLSKPTWFLLLGVGIVLGFLLIWHQYLSPAIGWTQDQWSYGNSRITQLDANVGHGGVSHFIATYSKGEIVIIEISLEHPNVSHIYTLTGFVGASGTPVILLSVQDLSHNGKPDLLVQVEGTSFMDVLYNTGTGFSENGG